MVKPPQPRPSLLPQVLRPVNPTQILRPVQPQVLQPVPPTALAPNAPAGPIMTAAVCCPDVATFEGSKWGRNTYFGFDDKTNLVARAGQDEYWIPPTATKALPGNREQRDGARWVSVGVGQETQVEIKFGGRYTNICLRNCTFEFSRTTIAEVTSPQPTASGVAFKIRGKAAGEASLKVMCDGKLRGYFHIWCAQRVTLELDVVGLKTGNTRAPSVTIANLRTVMNRVFSQALIRFSIRDLGQITLDSYMLGAHEWWNSSGGTIEMSSRLLNRLHNMANSQLSKRTATSGTGLLPRSGAYRLYYYIPDPNNPNAGGSVITVGQSPAFVFFDNAGSSDNSAAHEIGHALGLEHPVHNADRDQFPHHCLNTLNRTTTNQPATNTELAVPAGRRGKNIMAADPRNLMGYWTTKTEREPLRYRQWKACKRR